MGKVTPHPVLAQGPSLKGPEQLNSGHDVSQFSCQRLVLDDWLKRRALSSEARTARTYVVCSGSRVVGYYCLTVGSVQQKELPRKMKPHGTPTDVPVIIVGRLAVDENFAGQGIGKGLLKDAIFRSLQVAETVGVRAILVHALDEEAANFYKKYGFVQCQIDHRTHLLAIETAKEAL